MNVVIVVSSARPFPCGVGSLRKYSRSILQLAPNYAKTHKNASNFIFFVIIICTIDFFVVFLHDFSVVWADVSWGEHYYIIRKDYIKY